MNKLILAALVLFSLSTFANDEHEATEEHFKPLYPLKVANKDVATKPAQPELLEPKTFSTVSGDSVTLKWKEAAGADSYHVQVATDPNFKWLVGDAPLYRSTSFEVKGLEAGKHYYWRVAGMKSTNDQEFTKGSFARSMFKH